MGQLRIAVVVQGRFHAFDFSQALIRMGQDVQVFTNYPRSVAARFGLNRDCITNCLWHGIMVRALQKLRAKGRTAGHVEIWSHNAFSRWAARKTLKQRFDVVHCFSGVAHELWKTSAQPQPLRSLLRGSAHIETQHEILQQEEEQTGSPLEKPSPWMRQREIHEYEMSDQITVLSTFAWNSFVQNGVPPRKLDLIPLGSDVSRFRISNEVHRERRERILNNGRPLRVLTVGTWSHQKGSRYLLETARQCRGRALFRFVGALSEDARPLLKEAREFIEFRPRVAQSELPKEYEWADLFFFPTLQDGYAVVLAQAQASGLPILATPHSAAPDLIKEGVTGWIRPIRRPVAYAERILWAGDHRTQLAEMTARLRETIVARDWDSVAEDFLSAMWRRLGDRPSVR